METMWKSSFLLLVVLVHCSLAQRRKHGEPGGMMGGGGGGMMGGRFGPHDRDGPDNSPGRWEPMPMGGPMMGDEDAGDIMYDIMKDNMEDMQDYMNEAIDEDMEGMMGGGGMMGEEIFPVETEQQREEARKPLVRCKRPQCEEECKHGFQTDSVGCQTCECLKNTCDELTCEDGQWCEARTCDTNPCTVMVGQCVAKPCAMPMCRMYCPNGYEQDERGCASCKCKPHTCKGFKCPPRHHCSMRSDEPCVSDTAPNCHPKPHCVPDKQGDELCMDVKCDIGETCRGGLCEGATSLCNFMRRMHNSMPSYMKNMMGWMGMPNYMTNDFAHMPMCDGDGTFLPKQCHEELGLCWCVDDRGQEIEGSKRQNTELHACVQNRTHAIDLMFKVQHDLDNIRPLIEGLKTTMQSHVSNWLRMGEDSIIINQIAADEDSPNWMSVSCTVWADGKTDLPSAALYMHNMMTEDRTQIPYLGHTLMPDPKSVSMRHNYNTEPMLPQTGLRDGEPMNNSHYLRMHHIILMVGVTGGLIMIGSVVAFIIVVKKKQTPARHFQHKNMDNFDKNILIASEFSMPEEKKQQLAFDGDSSVA